MYYFQELLRCQKYYRNSLLSKDGWGGGSFTQLWVRYVYIYWVKSRNHNWFLYRYIKCFVIGCTRAPKYISFTIPTTVKCYLNMNSPISGNNAGHGLRAMLSESLCVTLKKKCLILVQKFCDRYMLLRCNRRLPIL